MVVEQTRTPTPRNRQVLLARKVESDEFELRGQFVCHMPSFDYSDGGGRDQCVCTPGDRRPRGLIRAFKSRDCRRWNAASAVPATRLCANRCWPCGIFGPALQEYHHRYAVPVRRPRSF